MSLAKPDTLGAPILYTQTGCAESAQVRTWLTDHGIRFRERDVSADSAATTALAATGIFATPLLVVGKSTVLGFRPRALAALLGNRDP
jgi:glutaredoxin